MIQSPSRAIRTEFHSSTEPARPNCRAGLGVHRSTELDQGASMDTTRYPEKTVFISVQTAVSNPVKPTDTAS